MRNNRIISLIPYLIVTLAIFSLLTMNMTPTVDKLTYSTYLDLLAKNKVTDAKVIVSDVVVNITGSYLDSKGNAVSYTFILKSL